MNSKPFPKLKLSSFQSRTSFSGISFILKSNWTSGINSNVLRKSSSLKLFPLIREIQENGKIGEKHTVRGWVKWIKVQKEVGFIQLDDGSSPFPLQIVSTKQPKDLKVIPHGSSIEVEGTLVKSTGKEQAIELELSSFQLIGQNDPKANPLQPKDHSAEFLREIAHLRPRTKQFAAVLRLRNASTMAIHQFFQNQGFIQVHTPILTTSDCEGGGEVFRVTTLPISPKDKGSRETQEDFFKKPTFLTVSGQLHAEMMACALSRVYCFGPTFRAEPGLTTKHLSEFWMLEPEMTFCDLEMCMKISEAMVKYLIQYLLNKHSDDLKLLHQHNDMPSLMKELEELVNRPFHRISFSEAISILQKSNTPFQFPVLESNDLQTEHEKYLTEKHFNYTPVFVYNWPKTLKPFYMRLNDDNTTVAAMDLLVPRIGELIGGSAREERYDHLKQNVTRLGINSEGQLDWYLDLRKYGTVPHAGFGLGFERFVQYITGINNIRDVIPLPRYNRHCNY